MYISLIRFVLPISICFFNIHLKHISAIDEVNTRALGESIRGSLRSHQLSIEQINGAENGNLNIICGFHIIDEHARMIFIEGKQSSIEFILSKIERKSANNKSCRILNNSDIGFQKRLYTAFNVDLKKIRLRDPLPVICEMPEIYNRTKVSPECFEGLNRLLSIRKANRLSELGTQSLFPLVIQLLQMESKYGESISMEDIDGRKVTARKSRLQSQTIKSENNAGMLNQSTSATGNALPTPPLTPQQQRQQQLQSLNSGRLNKVAGQPSSGPASVSFMPQNQTIEMEDTTFANINNTLGGSNTQNQGGKTSAQPERRKAATDSRNPLFEKSLSEYAPPDYLLQQNIEIEKSMIQYEKMKNEKQLLRENDLVPSKFVYSGQKLQYTELKKGEMRSKLAREKNTHFTYRFPSPPVCLLF